MDRQPAVRFLCNRCIRSGMLQDQAEVMREEDWIRCPASAHFLLSLHAPIAVIREKLLEHIQTEPPCSVEVMMELLGVAPEQPIPPASDEELIRRGLAGLTSALVSPATASVEQ